jgi:hypothetical protein
VRSDRGVGEGLRATIDAPAGTPPVDQAGAAAQLLGDLRGRVPLLGVEPDELSVVDGRTKRGRTRPARYSPGHKPVVHRLSRHPQPIRHRRDRQPLIDYSCRSVPTSGLLDPGTTSPLCRPDRRPHAAGALGGRAQATADPPECSTDQLEHGTGWSDGPRGRCPGDLTCDRSIIEAAARLYRRHGFAQVFIDNACTTRRSGTWARGYGLRPTPP